MVRIFASSLALAGILVCNPFAAAQEDQRRPQRDQGGLFDRLDANKDGHVTSDEVPEERKGYFDRLLRGGDKDKDGKLSREEFAANAEEDRPRRPAGDQPGGPRRPEGAPNFDPERAFRFMDRNGDGKLTAEEVSEERRDMFKANLARSDKDGDGAINLEEFKAGAEALARLMGRGPGPGGPPNLANAPFFRAIDADRDGKLSADELAKAGDALKRLDRNNDGFLTPEELAPPGGPSGGRPGARPDNPQQEAVRATWERLRRADANGDGKLSRDEAPERLKENFDRLDANSDGFIDQTEAARIFGRAGQNRPQDGNPPRRRPQQDDK